MPSSSPYQRHFQHHSFPTRRSSDLRLTPRLRAASSAVAYWATSSGPSGWPCSASNRLWAYITAFRSTWRPVSQRTASRACRTDNRRDRKSTRLNSSPVAISYAVFFSISAPLPAPLFPYPTLFRSSADTQVARRLVCRSVLGHVQRAVGMAVQRVEPLMGIYHRVPLDMAARFTTDRLACLPHRQPPRSEEHTSELQSRGHLVCRLLLHISATSSTTLSLPDALPIFG